MIKFITAILILTSLSLSAEDQSIMHTQNASFRTTYEVLTLPGEESMGLAGVNYLLHFTPWFYSGLGVYSAEYGMRGGFFTGGIDSGLMFNPFADFILSGGLFVGGGGGGAAPQGGGLMIRPYAGLMYDFGAVKFGGGFSRDIFPNGGIDSTQLFLQAEILFSFILLDNYSGDINNIPPYELRGKSYTNHKILALYQVYVPGRGVSDVDGYDSVNMGLAGIIWSMDLSRFIFMHMQAAGAMAGESDGYAELFAGGGGRLYISDGSGGEVKVSAGGAGGGRVDTGGGFVYKAGAGGFISVTEGVVISVDGFYLSTPSGSFRAKGVSAGIGGSFDILSSGDRNSGTGMIGEMTPARWRLRLGSKSYLPSGNMRKSSPSDERVDLMTFMADRFICDNIYITGCAVGAYDGGAGGYAEGLFGAGFITDDFFYGLSLFVEAAAGAAGGGGLATDGGAVVHPMAGISWIVFHGVSIEISAGVINALKGKLSSPVVEAGLGYRFSFIQKKASL